MLQLYAILGADRDYLSAAALRSSYPNLSSFRLQTTVPQFAPQKDQATDATNHFILQGSLEW